MTARDEPCESWEMGEGLKGRVVSQKAGLGLRQSLEEDLFIHLFIHSLFNKYVVMGIQ